MNIRGCTKMMISKVLFFSKTIRGLSSFAPSCHHTSLACRNRQEGCDLVHRWKEKNNQDNIPDTPLPDLNESSPDDKKRK